MKRLFYEKPGFYLFLGVAYVFTIFLAADKGYPFIAGFLGLAVFFLGAIWDAKNWAEHIERIRDELSEEFERIESEIRKGF